MFMYNAPTKLFIDCDLDNLGKIVKSYGYKNILLLYGGGSIKKSGLYDKVVQSLVENEINYVEAGGVEPNPKVSFVREVLAKNFEFEIILAVGGGSVIDTAKSIAVSYKTGIDPWKFNSHEVVPEKSMPVGVVLTISAAGSEMSASAVITNTELNMKKGFGTDYNRCLFAIMNPELTYTVSKYQTACGIVDIMAHTMERYFIDCEPTDITDQLAEGVLRSVISAGKTLMENPCDYDARANMMWASSVSHNGLTGCGRDNSLAVHQLEHALSGEYDYIAHGAGLAVLIPAWARYVYHKKPERFAQIARNVWGVEEKDDLKASLIGIEKMEEYFTSIGMPLKLREFDIPENCLERLSDLCTFGKKRTVKSYIELDYDVILEIYKSCY